MHVSVVHVCTHLRCLCVCAHNVCMHVHFLCNMSSIEFHTDKLLAHGM